MLALALALVVSQPEQATPAATDAPAQPALPAWVTPPPAPGAEPEAAPPRVSSAPPSVTGRLAFTGLGAIAGSAAGLGVTLLLTNSGSSVDTVFSTAMLSALLLTGVGFTVHQSMGGQGEVMLALLGAAVTMGVSGAAAHAIDGTTPAGPILTTVIGTVPAAALAVLSLELTSRDRRVRTALVPLPSGGAQLVFAVEL